MSKFGLPIAPGIFVAKTLGLEEPDAILDEFQAGKGWGEIMKDNGLHPGLAGRGGNLGGIMSGRDQMLPPGQLKKMPSEGEADVFVPPGQRKKQAEDGSGFVPPGQLKKSGGDESEDQGGPPGKSKDKGNKGKKH